VHHVAQHLVVCCVVVGLVDVDCKIRTATEQSPHLILCVEDVQLGRTAPMTLCCTSSNPPMILFRSLQKTSSSRSKMRWLLLLRVVSIAIATGTVQLWFLFCNIINITVLQSDRTINPLSKTKQTKRNRKTPNNIMI